MGLAVDGVYIGALVRQGAERSVRVCMGCAGSDAFVCVGSYSRKDKRVGEPPAQYAAKIGGAAAGKGKGKGAAAAEAAAPARCGPQPAHTLSLLLGCLQFINDACGAPSHALAHSMLV